MKLFRHAHPYDCDGSRQYSIRFVKWLYYSLAIRRASCHPRATRAPSDPLKPLKDRYPRLLLNPNYLSTWTTPADVTWVCLLQPSSTTLCVQFSDPLRLIHTDTLVTWVYN